MPVEIRKNLARYKREVVYTVRTKLWEIYDGEEYDRPLMMKIGRTMVRFVSLASREYMKKIGWSGKDPRGGPAIWDSFSYKISNKNIEILSTFWGLKDLVRVGIKPKKMVWLTAGAGGPRKVRFRGPQRRVIPIKGKNGNVEFRSVPLKTSDAWIHHGIARFNFLDNAIRKGRVECKRITSQYFKKRESKQS